MIRSRLLSVECLEARTLPDAGLPHLLTLPREDFVGGLYRSLLDRAPTSREHDQLTRDLAAGESRLDAVAGVLAAGEYGHQPGGWLPNLYDDVLGRAPDDHGLTAWRQAKRDGLSREAIARAFLQGREFQRRISTAYVAAAAAGAPDFDHQTLAPLLVKVTSGVSNGLTRLTALVGGGATVEPTDVPRLFRVNGSDTALTQLATSLPGSGFVRYVEPEQTVHLDVAPNDPSYTDGTTWGLDGDYGVNAPTAWNTATGSTKVTVAVIDTGVDYDHPDLFKNVWVNQAEIPATWLTKSGAGSATYDRSVGKSQVRDVDGDGKITFWDLNNDANAGLVWDSNGDGRVSASDILRSRPEGGWEDGVDNSGDGYRDDLVGWNFIDNNNRPFDDNEHGTHCSGTIGALGNNGAGVAGVNWVAQIMAVKFLSAEGHGSDEDAAAALRYSAANGARVSSNSWGGPEGDQTLRDAISYAGSKGQIVVAAAGNDGNDIGVTPAYPAAYHLPNMIVVAATDRYGDLAYFSNYSSTLVDVAAPGVSVYSTIPGGDYTWMSGTSMATPHVAGVVTLVLGARPNLTMTEAIGRVVNNTRPLDSVAGKTVTGGLVDAAKALGAPGNPGAPATPGTPSWSAGTGSNGYLSWGAVSGATGYNVQSSSDGNNWSLYATASSPSANVPAGFYYRVAATNSTGTSGYSPAVFATPSVTQPPATPGRPSWSSTGGTNVTLAWNAVSGATGYQVQWWNSSAGSWATLGTYTGTSVAITRGLGYYWRVAATNASGTSGYSPYTLAGQAPNQPSWSWAGGSDINLYWNNVGATGYVVQYWSATTSTWVTLATYGGGATSDLIYRGYGYYWRVGAVYSTSDPVYSTYVLVK